MEISDLNARWCRLCELNGENWASEFRTVVARYSLKCHPVVAVVDSVAALNAFVAVEYRAIFAVVECYDAVANGLESVLNVRDSVGCVSIVYCLAVELIVCYLKWTGHFLLSG